MYISTPLLRNGCFFDFSPIASLHPAMLRGTARERLMPGLLLSLFFQPLRPSDTSPIFCVAKHRGGGLMPFCRIILANDMDCISLSPPLQFFIEDRGYSSGLLHSKLICRTLLSPLPVFSNPSVTMCPLPLLYGCATPCKVTGARQGRSLKVTIYSYRLSHKNGERRGKFFAKNVFFAILVAQKGGTNYGETSIFRLGLEFGE